MCIKTHKQETPISGDAAERPSQEPFVIPNPLRRRVSHHPLGAIYVSLPLGAPWPSSNPHWPESADRFNNTAIFPAHGPNIPRASPRALVTLSSAYGRVSPPLLFSRLYSSLFSFSYRPVRSLIPHRTNAERDLLFVERSANADKRSASWYRISRYSTNFPRLLSFPLKSNEKKGWTST